MAKLEQGQRAYEAYAEALRSKSFFITPWEKLEGCSRYGFAAVEQACAVPAATQGGKTELFALADAWLKHAAVIRSDEGVVAAAEALEDCATELLSLAEAGKAQSEWEDLLNAARMVITAHTCKHPDLSREEAESRAMRALIVAVDAFPHPCAAAAIPPSPSAPEGT